MLTCLKGGTFMEETIEILKEQANGYLIMAKALKAKGIENKHYLASAKRCCEMALEIRIKLDEIEEMMAA